MKRCDQFKKIERFYYSVPDLRNPPNSRADNQKEINHADHMAIIQNSPSGIWPTLAKKYNPFTSSFAKFSWSLFSYIDYLGVSIRISIYERSN